MDTIERIINELFEVRLAIAKGNLEETVKNTIWSEHSRLERELKVAIRDYASKDINNERLQPINLT